MRPRLSFGHRSLSGHDHSPGVILVAAGARSPRRSPIRSLLAASSTPSISTKEHSQRFQSTAMGWRFVRSSGICEVPLFRLPAVDGILMANALHFIQEQQLLLRRLHSVTGRFLIVEYERSKPNRWGSYPIGFERFRQLSAEEGLGRVEKLATRPSLFGGTMYSALAERIRT